MPRASSLASRHSLYYFIPLASLLPTIAVTATAAATRFNAFTRFVLYWILQINIQAAQARRKRPRYYLGAEGASSL
jgi:hypothetical protein